MIIVDTALAQRQEQGDPIRVGIVGAGSMGRAVAVQMVTATAGMELVAIANRHPDRARSAFAQAGLEGVGIVNTSAQLQDALSAGRPAVTDDAMLLCRAQGIDAIVEVTGTVEFGAHVAMGAIEHGKHIILVNAELDGTLGPMLKVYGDKAGVIITNADGDQPGTIMNLYRFVKGIGIKPVLCGNIKGLQDRYRNPTTQASFARKWQQTPGQVTSAADGTKISFEQAIVANATGMDVAQRGMLGPTVPAGTPIEQAVDWYPKDVLLRGAGIVDYVVGAAPSPGVFVLGTCDRPDQQHLLNYYKLGPGPLYCFHTAFHLANFEVPGSIARAVLFKDATIAPIGRPYVDVVAAAKTDLAAGHTLDGIGGYDTYGLCENAQVVHAQRLLPMGLAEGCRLKRDICRDQVLCYDDVDLPQGRLSDKLRAEQDARYDLAAARTVNT